MVERDEFPRCEGVFRSYPTDPALRRAKAEKILRILGEHRPLAGARLLEVGVGSGQMTRSFAEAVGPAGRVVGADVVDVRLDDPGTEFHLVDGVELPFEDGSFDVAISNHVIEHVGSPDDQALHLRALRSVVRPGGAVYLGAPSRWGILEPHYRLPFLSWLPRRLRSPYVRLARRGHVYDVEPLSPRELDQLAAHAGFEVTDATTTAMRLLAETEPGHPAAPLIRLVPRRLDRYLGRLMPIQVRLLVRPPAGPPRSG